MLFSARRTLGILFILSIFFLFFLLFYFSLQSRRSYAFHTVGSDVPSPVGIHGLLGSPACTGDAETGDRQCRVWTVSDYSSSRVVFRLRTLGVPRFLSRKINNENLNKNIYAYEKQSNKYAR